MFLPYLGLPRLVRRSPALHVAGPLCRSPGPAALQPLGLASLLRSPLTVLVLAPPQGPGAASTPGAPPLRSSRRGRAAAARVGPLCASAGRWGTPADACCTARRARPPFGPLAWRPPPPRQSPQRACPDPPQARGLCPPPERPPLRSSGRGRAAAARVGTLCATAGRWGSPADALVAHGRLPRRTLWLCVPPRPPSRGARGVRSSLALSPLRGLCPTAPWRLTPAALLVRC